jgi:hypothetical protein
MGAGHAFIVLTPRGPGLFPPASTICVAGCGRRVPDSNSKMVLRSIPLRADRVSIDILVLIRSARSLLPLNRSAMSCMLGNSETTRRAGEGDCVALSRSNRLSPGPMP